MVVDGVGEKRRIGGDWEVGYLYEGGNARRLGNQALGMEPTNQRAGSRTWSDLPGDPRVGTPTLPRRVSDPHSVRHQQCHFRKKSDLEYSSEPVE